MEGATTRREPKSDDEAARSALLRFIVDVVVAFILTGTLVTLAVVVASFSCAGSKTFGSVPRRAVLGVGSVHAAARLHSFFCQQSTAPDGTEHDSLNLGVPEKSLKFTSRVAGSREKHFLYI